MKRTRLDSSELKSVGYDSFIKILEAEFISGDIYQYFDVPEDIYHDLINAESHGRFFNEYIRNGEYEYCRLKRKV